MVEEQKQIERLQDWARIGLAIFIASNYTISMFYPNRGLEINQTYIPKD